jgi:hypothetical protein
MATTAPVTVPGQGRTPPAPTRSAWVLAVAIGVVLVPAALLVARAVFGSWTAASDHAAIELRTRAVGGGDTPFVGPYSRFGWNHPGPLLFYLLAIPYRLFGSEGSGLLAGALMINASALACSVWIFWRRGRLAGVACGALVLFALVRALGADFLEDPWNPYVVVIPVFTMFLLAWSVADGDHWFLPLLAFVASFVTQTHVSLLPASIACVAFAGAFVIADARRGEAHRLGRVAIVSALVAAIAWLPPLVDQFRGGGNLGDIWEFWTSGTEPGPSSARALRIVAAELDVLPTWIGGGESLDFSAGALSPGWSVPVLLLFLIAATVLAARRRDRTSVTICSLALVLVAVSCVAAARIVGEPLPYLLRWTWSVGAFCGLAVVWTALRELEARAWRWRPLVAGAAAVAAGLLVAVTLSALTVDPPAAREAEITERLAPPIIEAMRAAPKPVLVEHEDTLGSAVISAGLLAELVRAGIPAGFESDREWVVGAPYVIDESQAGTTLLVIGDELDPRAYDADPSNRRLARFDSLSPEERAFLTEFEAEFQRVIDEMDDTEVGVWLRDQEARIERAAALAQRSARGAVYVVLDDA